MRCGVVRCGAVTLLGSVKGGDAGLVWFGVVWSGLVSCLVLSVLVWFGLVWFVLFWSGLIWCGLVWFGLVCSVLIWSGIFVCGQSDDSFISFWPILNVTAKAETGKKTEEEEAPS